MFLGQMEKPDVDYIDGLSPAISIDQKTTSQNPRSTVGTVTEIYDYLRLLWARVGTPHCPNCGKEIKQQTIDQIVDQVMALAGGHAHSGDGAGHPRQRRASTPRFSRTHAKSGYVRVRVDGSMYDLSEEIKLEKNIKHSIEVVVDRLVLKPDVVHRLSDSAETARGARRADWCSSTCSVARAGYSVLAELRLRGLRHLHRGARRRGCSRSTIPYGACPACTGLGSQLKVDPELVIPNQDALHPRWGYLRVGGGTTCAATASRRMYFDALSKKYQLLAARRRSKDSRREVMDVILYGTNGEKLRAALRSAARQGRALPAV